MSRAGAKAGQERKRIARQADLLQQELEDIGWDEGHQLVSCDNCGLEQIQLLDAFGHWQVPPVVCVLCGCPTCTHVEVLARP